MFANSCASPCRKNFFGPLNNSQIRIMNPRTTALVLIEYQNDFTTPRGKLHEAVKAVMESTNMLENTVEMVDEARKAGATIVAGSGGGSVCSASALAARL